MLSLLLATVPLDPALLRRVAEHLARLDAAQQNVTYAVTVQLEELDADGKVKSTEESEHAVTVKDGQASRQLVRRTAADGGLGAEAKGKRADDKKDKRATLQSTLPFHPGEQKKYRFSPLPEDARRPGLVHVAFEPAGGEKAPELLIGDALMDAATGELVHLDMRASKNPTFVDNLWMAVELSAPTPAGRAVSGFDVASTASFAFVKRRVRVTTRISDYRPLE